MIASRRCAQCSKPLDAFQRYASTRRYCNSECSTDAAHDRYKGERAGTYVRAKKPRTPIVFEPTDLYLGSTPIECAEATSIEKVERQVGCRRAMNCTSHAAAEGWKGYSCASCKIYDPMSVDQHRQDLPGLALLLIALDVGGRQR